MGARDADNGLIHGLCGTARKKDLVRRRADQRSQLFTSDGDGFVGSPSETMGRVRGIPVLFQEVGNHPVHDFLFDRRRGVVVEIDEITHQELRTGYSILSA